MVNEMTQGLKDYYAEFYNTNDDIIRINNIERWIGFISIVSSSILLYDIFVVSKRPPTTTSRSNGGGGRNIRARQQTRIPMNHRITAAMSISDIGYSFLGPFLGPWLAPNGQGHQSFGTIGTCVFQAVFNDIFGSAAGWFSALLSVCYVLMVRYNWNEDQLKKYQLLFLGLPIVIGLPQIIVYTAYGGGNFAGRYCGIVAPHPPLCPVYPGSCERGEKIAELWRTNKMYYMLTWPSFVILGIVTSSMILLFQSVRAKEVANDRYRFNGRGGGGAGGTMNYHHQATSQTSATPSATTTTEDNNNHPLPNNTQPEDENIIITTSNNNETKNNNETHNTTTAKTKSKPKPPTGPSLEERREARKLSRKVAWQGIFWIFALLIVWLPWVTQCVIWYVSLADETYMTPKRQRHQDNVSEVLAWLQPSAGFWNCLVYFRPRIVTYVENKRKQQRQQRAAAAAAVQQEVERVGTGES